MKILNIMLGKGLGGIEQSSLDYNKALQEAGHHVIYVTHPEAAINKFAAPYNSVKLGNKGSWDALASWKLRSLCIKENIDMIIAHGNRALCLCARFKARNVKLINVAHNYNMQHMNKANAVLCITQDVRNTLITNTCHTEATSFILPNMVAMPKNHQRHSWHSPLRIGAMGRLVAKKGFDVWIKSLVLLKERNISFEAWLGGTGPEMEALQALASKHGLAEMLQFKGWVSPSDMFYHDIDLFCIPSHHEPFGIVIIEAMAASLPVIATKSEGALEILEGTTYGVLIEKNNPKALADTIERMINEPDKARNMAKRAQDHVRETYTHSAISKTLRDYLEKISVLP